MKSIPRKALSVFVVMILLAQMLQVVFALTVSGENAGAQATFTDISFGFSEYDKSYDGGVGTYWVITMTADKNIGFGSSNYWKKNLQQYMNESQSTDMDNWEEHNALAEQLRKNIYINGISVEDGLNGDSDIQTSTRLRAGDENLESSKKVFYIYVRAEFVGQPDNFYHLNDYSDFTLEFKEGVKLNGYSITPVKYYYHSDTQSFTVNTPDVEDPEEPEEPDIQDDPNGANIVNTVLSESQSFCTSHSNVTGYSTTPQWVVDVYFDKNILPDSSDVSSYYRRHLAVDSALSNNGVTTVGSNLRKAIFLNGKNLDLCIAADTAWGDQYLSVHVQLLSGTNGAYLRIAVPKNNTFGFNGNSDFTVAISSGIKFNNIPINGRNVDYNASTGKFAVNKFSVPEQDAGIRPNSVSISSKENVSSLGCGDAGHENGAVWVVELAYGLSISPEIASSANYWLRHLQANSEYKDMICSNIYLNNKSLKSCISTETTASSRGEYTALHVMVAGSAGNVLQLVIPKDNSFGFNGSSDFTVSISKGIKFGKSELSAITVHYTAQTNAFAVGDFEQIPPEQIVMLPTSINVKTVAAVSSKTEGAATNAGCTDGAHETGEQWIIELIYPESVTPAFPSNANYWAKHTQAHADFKTVLCNNIRINGESLASILATESLTTHDGETSPRNIYTAFHIMTNGNALQLVIPKNNAYGFNGDNEFTVMISKGIRLSENELMPCTITHHSDGTNTIVGRTGGEVDGHITDVKLRTENNMSWVIALQLDQDITVTGGADTDLQFADRQRTEARKMLSEKIVSNITINGETLAESMERAGNHYTARVSASGPELLLKVNMKTPNTYDNDFYISDITDFSICLRDVVDIEGVKIQPCRYVYNAATKDFTVSTAEDVKNIGSSLLSIQYAKKDSDQNSIMLWPTGSSRYVDFVLDARPRGLSKNAQSFANDHGRSVRECIFVDGMSISEWISYGAGDLYHIMVRFEGNYIRFLFDGSREPGMLGDEYHRIEIKEGLITSAGERIKPCKLYYEPETLSWRQVESFEGLEKPWWILNEEERTAFAGAGLTANPNYVQPQFDWNESPVYAGVTTQTGNGGGASSSGGGTTIQKVVETTPEQQITVKKRKKIKSDVTYEYYFPVWAITLVSVGAVLVIGGMTTFIIVRKRRKALSK